MAKAHDLKKRKALPVDVRKLVLHECGYRCAVPTCRWPLTLDVHHMEYVSEGGPDTAENLLPVCRNCHGMIHDGAISRKSVRAWKMLLLALNEGYDRRSIDALLLLNSRGFLRVSGDAFLQLASLAASGFIAASYFSSVEHAWYEVQLTERGKLFVDAWRRGDQSVLQTQSSRD